MCGKCMKTFVSVESAPAGQKMPAETQSRNRITDKKPKPEQSDGIIRNSGEHLKWTW